MIISLVMLNFTIAPVFCQDSSVPVEAINEMNSDSEADSQDDIPFDEDELGDADSSMEQDDIVFEEGDSEDALGK